MDILEELIIEGKELIKEYDKTASKNGYGHVEGIEYEAWMGRVKIFANSKLQENPLKEELDVQYKKRNNYLGTMGVEKVLGILSALQSTDSKGEKKGNGMKVFISHSSKDKVYGDLLLELLVGLKLNREEIIYTSNELYGIPLGEKIYDYLRDNIESDIHMIFLLSENYFQSVACLNEMGASWLAQKNHTIIGVPGFDFSMREFRDCCLDSKKMGLNMSNYIRITEFKGNIESSFGKRIDDMEWQALLEKYKKDLIAIANDTGSINFVKKKSISENKDYARNVLTDVLNWLGQLLGYAERCSTQLENSLNKANPETRREKYREFSDSLSEMTREYLTSRNKQIVLLESIGSSIDLNGYFHSEISEFIDNLEKLGEGFIHQPNTEDSVDINNRIYKRFEDAVTAQQRMIGEELKFTKAVGDL